MIHILFLEDNRDDVEIVAQTYQSAGLSVAIERVESQPLFRQALEKQEWDLLLLDYALPRFDGIAALDVARKIRPELPAVILSGVMAEDLATETLKIGAADYVLKDGLERLVPVTQRVLRDAERRKELMRQFRSSLTNLHGCVAELRNTGRDTPFAIPLARLGDIAQEIEALAAELVGSRR
jgi:DNA-binding NtrC family response regulator